MIRAFLVFLLLLPAPLVPAKPARAQAMPPDMVRVSLLSGWRMASGAHMAALRVTLAPGWKTYWRAPGETGIPPVFDWDRTENLKSVRPLWPRPEIIDGSDGRSIGYHNELVLPLKITPVDGTTDIRGELAVEIGVCNDVCVPYSARLEVRLPPAGEEGRFLIELALAERELSAAESGVRLVSCTVSPQDEGYDLSAEITTPSPLPGSETVVFETPDPDLWIAPVKMRRNGDRLRADAPMTGFGDAASRVGPAVVTVTFIDAAHAVDLGACGNGDAG